MQSTAAGLCSAAVVLFLYMKLLAKDTYLTMIENSVGSHLFRTVYAEIDGERKDITQAGNFSCAFFVSTILSHFNFKLIKEAHTGIRGLIKDMEESGWTVTDKLIPGAVVVWEQVVTEPTKTLHDHLGFVFDEHTAVSTYDLHVCTPIKHDINYADDPNGKPWRAIEKIYTHPFLET